MAAPRIRVLTLIDRLGPVGGAERLAVQIATGLDPERFESHFCASRHDASQRADEGTHRARESLDAAGVRFLGVPRETKLDMWKWAALPRYLRRESIDVLHAHKHGSNVWGAGLGRLARVPVVVAHEHSWSFEGRPLRRFLDREVVARGSDAFVAVSRADRDRMISVERVPAESVVFVPNGAPSRDDDGPVADVRAELGIPAGAPLIGSVGFLRRQKRFDLLIRAIARVSGTVPDVHAVIAGEGDERPALEALIAELGVEDRVKLLGRRLDVPDVLAALDVAVCSSEFEGSPLSVMEYMEAGLPVVGAAVGGVPDLIEDGVHGRIVPPLDDAALATAIADLLADPDARRRMGEAGHERRRAEFDLSVTVRRFEELYVELLGRSRARATA